MDDVITREPLKIRKVVNISETHRKLIEAEIARDPEKYKAPNGVVSAGEVYRAALDLFFGLKSSV